MKKAFLFFITLATNIAFAQIAKLENDKVLYDGKPILRFEKMNSNYSFYSLETDDEILYYTYDFNGTSAYVHDDVYTLNFLTEKIKIESRYFEQIGSISTKKSMQKLIELLVKEKVLSLDGKINREKLEIFYDKYNEVIIR